MMTLPIAKWLSVSQYTDNNVGERTPLSQYCCATNRQQTTGRNLRREMG
jgi:hypothetical protein